MRRGFLTCFLWILGGAAVFSAPADGGGFLLNNGSIPNGTGRKVSGINVADGWTVYQPFDVTDPDGWLVDSFGVDSWRVLDPTGFGHTGMICPDDGTGTAPDCSNPIAVAEYHIDNINPFESGWVDAPFSVELEGNTRYWFVSSANHVDYWSSLFHAPQGLPSYSIRTSDGMRFDDGPTALRIRSLAAIPTVSEWGLAIMTLIILVGITLSRTRPVMQKT